MKAVLGFAITHAAWSYLLDAVGAEGIQNSGQGESSFTPGAPRWGPGSCVTCCSSTKGRGFWALPTPNPHRGKSGSLGASGPLAHPRPPLRGSPPAPALRQVPRGQVLETHAPTPPSPAGKARSAPRKDSIPDSETSVPGAVRAGGAESLTAETPRQLLRSFGPRRRSSAGLSQRKDGSWSETRLGPPSGRPHGHSLQSTHSRTDGVRGSGWASGL